MTCVSMLGFLRRKCAQMKWLSVTRLGVSGGKNATLALANTPNSDAILVTNDVIDMEFSSQTSFIQW